jgi:hypothetical protein
MTKTFYTDRDIDDMIRDGITSLVIDDDIVVTDVARERAYKSDFKFIRENDIAPSTPVRPYLSEKLVKKTVEVGIKKTESNIEQLVFDAVRSRVGDSVDPDLLRTIIKRIIKSIGGS